MPPFPSQKCGFPAVQHSQKDPIFGGYYAFSKKKMTFIFFQRIFFLENIIYLRLIAKH
tara:strand:- start:2541 stop:2714 length:174 start_codon:yes stop_codon:yes gene_type:complete